MMENKGWTLTDYDCLQYCKQYSDTEFSFIQAVWLDGDDNSDSYAVCAGYIDLNLYATEDIESAIAAYDYTMESVKEIYDDAANQIIAECLFETDCLYDCCSIAGVIPWEDAAQIIYKYINER